MSDDPLERARPECAECYEPVVRYEAFWRDTLNQLEGQEAKEPRWQLYAFLVCAAGHRVPVEPFDDLEAA